MKRFKNILTHVDLAIEDHPALARGAWLARHNNALLTAMSVVEEHPAVAHALLRSLHLEGALETIARDHHEELDIRVKPIRDAGLDVKTIVAHGSTFAEVIRAALHRQHDLVIKSVSSKGLCDRTFFGSTDMQLLRNCPTPLWLIKSGEPESFRRILVPLDPNMEDGVKFALGFDLLSLATSLAEIDGAELMIVYAWHAYEQKRVKRHFAPEQFDEYMHAWKQESSKRTMRFISVFGSAIKPESIHVVQGEPHDVIPKFAKDNGVDLVVMGTLGRLGQHGMFIGDTAEHILNQLECSVLAVKPAGFSSPVH